MDRAQGEREGMPLSRRGFLQLGLGSAAALAVLGGAAGCARPPPAPASGFYFLSPSDVALFTALLPAVAGAAWPSTPEAAATQRDAALRHIDRNCEHLGAGSQAELRKLFDLLHSGLLRRLAAGVQQDWPQMSVADVQAFLARWQHSRLALFNAGHRVLVRFCASAFWGHPDNWAAAGYPGPPAAVLTALRA